MGSWWGEEEEEEGRREGELGMGDGGWGMKSRRGAGGEAVWMEPGGRAVWSLEGGRS